MSAHAQEKNLEREEKVLEKVICIDNIGVIKSGVPKAIDLAKVTLVYADNARGKSTLATLMRACSAGDASALVKCKTVGAKNDQKVNLRFKTPDGHFNAMFDGRNWSGGSPNLHVFNQDFIERNVYASTGVTPDQRASLLDLALGDAAVAQQAEFNNQSEIQRARAGDVSAAEGALSGFRGILSLNKFIALSEIADVDNQIQAFDKQITDARGVAQTLAKPNFRKLVAPTFDLDDFKSLAASEFEQVQDGAEALVKKHFAEHLGAETERWVSDGAKHAPKSNCPFCGQETEGLELLTAYKAYFNQAYKDHLAKVQTIRSLVAQCVPLTALSDWEGVLAFNNGAVGSWIGDFDFLLPTIDITKHQSIILAAQNALLHLAEQKLASPLEAIGPDAIDAVMAQLKAETDSVDIFNAKIDDFNSKIIEHKKTLAAADVNALTTNRTSLALHKVRHDAMVKPMIDAVIAARAGHKAAEAAKDTAKEQLEKLMSVLLTNFQAAINAWLVTFGTPFKLKELKHTYAGGGVRSQYVIEVRGTEVAVGPAAPGELTFHSVLSEGDKRTLGFAFFLAKLFEDPSRAHATVVLDDVFTSLDHHRRHNTIDAAVRVASECAQVIALGHDAHFLRELRKRAENKKVGSTIELFLQRDAENYSLLAKFDLDEFCASDYYKRYVLVEQFIAGLVQQNQLLDVAIALRPLVEGHLHKCFPKRFKEGQTVGQMLDVVKNAIGQSPLVALQSLLGGLTTFNDYAAAYHHDTSGVHPRVDTNDAELLYFATGAMRFIQLRTFA